VAKTTGSRGNWLTGHLIEFGRDPLTFLRESSSREGDFISLRFFSKQARIINSTAAIEDVLATRQRSFLKARGMTNRIAERLFGNGLLTSEGATWTRQRRLVQPAFHRKRIAGYADAVVELSEALIADWKDGDRRSVHDDMVHYTTQVISRTLFGSEPPEAIVDLEKASLIMMERMGAPPSLWRLLVGLIPVWPHCRTAAAGYGSRRHPVVADQRAR
jgi:cytochrome P450